MSVWEHTTKKPAVQVLPTWKVTLALIRKRPGPWLVWSLALIFFHTSQLVPGLIQKRFFDTLAQGTLAQGTPAGLGSLWSLLALLLAVEGSRVLANLATGWGETTFRDGLKPWMWHNLLSGMLERPGALGLPVAPGEALNRFQHDVGEVCDFPLWIAEVLGHLIFAVAAFVVLFRVSPLITLVVFLPLLLVIVVAQIAWARMLRTTRQARQAGEAVSGFLGEIFNAIQAIKIAGAEEGVLARFNQLSEKRRRAEVRLRLTRASLDAIFNHMVDLAIGATLLLAAGAITRNDFSIGDFALFVSYMFYATRLPGILGGFIGDYQTQAVSIGRLLALQPETPPERLLAPGALYLQHDPPPLAAAPAPAAGRLERLEVRGLSYHYPIVPGEAADNGAHGIQGIDLALQRGDFVVVTGRVGSGKTTLLRALLGLLPAQSGEIRWNGQAVDDPARFFTPPQAAYTPQTPRLYSESLRDNILMGRTASGDELQAALELAVLEPDIATLEAELDTLVGPRGVRLSGGQVQRAAAARMFVRQPELLVFDDLSSALDVETESLLWQRLAAQPERTCLVVSHRRAALSRADWIVVLAHGQVAAQGKLETLLQTSAALQDLWYSDKTAN